MPDSLMLADVRASRFVRPGDGAVELTGRSPAITRVQELVRRGAALEGGALITAEPGADAASVAREFHLRSRHSNAPYVVVECDASDPVDVDRLLFRPAPDRLGDRSRGGFERLLHRRSAWRHPVSPERDRAARVGAGAAGARRARRRSPDRRRSGCHRAADCRQRRARHRSRSARPPLPQRSLPAALDGTHRPAAAPRSPR